LFGRFEEIPSGKEPMTPDPAAWLEAMRMAIATVQALAAGRSRGDLPDQAGVQDAVLYNLSVIGLAARQLPPAVQGWAPEVPWGAICSQWGDLPRRNRLAPAAAWRIVQDEIPVLLVAVGRCRRLLQLGEDPWAVCATVASGMAPTP
jgi:uncharacterized protein with HEPN domain